jgi:hypothetical protein
MLEILKGSIVSGRSGRPLKVISVDEDILVLESDDGLVRAKRSAILRVISPPPVPKYYLGDRVTLADKYQARAADVGTVEAFTESGVQILWDNQLPLEPNFKQPSIAWRTFAADELELVEHMYQQN